jgi:hypothetical protein
MNTTPIHSHSVAVTRPHATLFLAALGTFLALALVCLTLAAPVLAAETAAPGWEVTSTTFPTNLAPGSAVDEVQEVTVAAAEGTFTLAFRGDETAAIPFNAPAATVQADLQALPSIGAGNVTVTGGPGDATGTKPYVLTFTGALGGVDTGEILTNGEQLAGGTATDTVTTKGAAGGALELNVYNVGAAPSTGQVTVTDTLPAGVLATRAGDVQDGATSIIGQHGLWDCTGTGPGPPPGVEGASVVTCTNDPVSLPSLPVVDVPSGGPFSTNFFESGGGEILHLGVGVTVQPGAVTGENRVTVSGGGASETAATHAPVTVSSSPAPAFGFQNIDGWASRANGTIDTQAGSHPYELDFTFDLNTERDYATGDGNLVAAGGRPRDLAVKLPPGLVGNPAAVPRCSRTDFDNERCNPAMQVGVDVANAAKSGKIVPFRAAFPVYNLVPPPGLPAQFGFVIVGQQVFLDFGVRSGGNYGITVHANALPQGQVDVVGNRFVLWGEPSDPSHDGYRYSGFWENGKCGSVDPGSGCASSAPRIPFLTLASSCAGPQETVASVNAWETAGFGEMGFVSHDAAMEPVGVTGCDHLTFAPSISVAPDTSSADTPAGLTVDVQVPQEGLVTPGALATSDIRSTTVTLPEGFVINPGQAAGLQACQAGQDGLTTEAEKAEGKENNGPASCPNASKVGTITATTPLLEGAAEKELKGNIYVLQSDPPNLRLLVTPSADGVYIKQVLNVHLDEATGRLTTTVKNFPEAPVSDVKLSFSGGAQAALDTPTQCGTYTTTSDFEPWSAPAVGDAFPSSSFQITSGTGGSACPSGTLPFGPSLIAGATNPKGGAFTGFSLLLQSGDGQQRIEKLQFKAPQGLSGMLSAVPLCQEPQAAQGTCSSASQIGHASVAAGPGPYPLSIPQPGDPESPIYLTGPYQGAPFGLTIVTHALAGPFNLGNVITRARIEVDIHTAQITVTTDPLPQVIDGVPTDLRLVDSVIDRPGFMFNPTHCAPAAFAGTAWGTPPPGAGGQGATAGIASSFDVVGCKGLGFAPKFAVATSGKTSRSKGASLHVHLTYPQGPQGAYANIHSVKVELPKQLPSRLTTLQKACTAAQFESNPAGCPAASVIGHAKAITPILPVPLEGPAYFVSHGGEAFPSLIIVLQGYGVTLDLVGTTFISKAGITSSTFKTVPDQPVGSFELTLPEGKYSALAANGNLCSLTHTLTSKKTITKKIHGHNRRVVKKTTRQVAAPLKMPTEFVAQNGAVLHQSTPIAVTGCTNAHKAKAKKTRTAHHKGSH